MMIKMLLVAKEVQDTQLAFYVYKLTGLCFLFQGGWYRARIIFELMRDIATEQNNNGNLMEIYELIGRALE